MKPSFHFPETLLECYQTVCGSEVSAGVLMPLKCWYTYFIKEYRFYWSHILSLVAFGSVVF